MVVVGLEKLNRLWKDQGVGDLKIEVALPESEFYIWSWCSGTINRVQSRMSTGWYSWKHIGEKVVEISLSIPVGVFKYAQ